MGWELQLVEGVGLDGGAIGFAYRRDSDGVRPLVSVPFVGNGALSSKVGAVASLLFPAQINRALRRLARKVLSS